MNPIIHKIRYLVRISSFNNIPRQIEAPLRSLSDVTLNLNDDDKLQEHFSSAHCFWSISGFCIYENLKATYDFLKQLNYLSFSLWDLSIFTFWLLYHDEILSRKQQCKQQHLKCTECFMSVLCLKKNSKRRKFTAVLCCTAYLSQNETRNPLSQINGCQAQKGLRSGNISRREKVELKRGFWRNFTINPDSAET